MPSDFDLIGLLCALIAGYPIFTDALADLGSQRTTRHVSATIALAASLVMGEVFAALVLILILLITRLFEEQTENRAALAERLETYLVYLGLGAAFFTLLVTRDVRCAISAMIVSFGCQLRGTASEARALPEEPEVIAIVPQPGVAEDELLSIGAAVHSSSAAILNRARARAVPVTHAEDSRFLQPGGVHCWVNGLPTLAGSRDFITRLGFRVENAPYVCEEIYVAQGSRLLGKIQVSKPAAAPAPPPKLGRRDILANCAAIIAVDILGVTMAVKGGLSPLVAVIIHACLEVVLVLASIHRRTPKNWGQVSDFRPRQPAKTNETF
jgi:cation transport ATPase